MAQSHKYSPQIPRSGKSHISIFRKGVGPSSYSIPITTKDCETYKSSVRKQADIWWSIIALRSTSHQWERLLAAKEKLNELHVHCKTFAPQNPILWVYPPPHPISFQYLRQLPYCTTWANSHKVQGRLGTNEPGLKFSWLRKGNLHHSRGPYIISFQLLSHGRYM